MSSNRCPYLELERDGGIWGITQYRCTLTGVVMYEDDVKVKHLCKAEGYEYEKCPVYQDR